MPSSELQEGISEETKIPQCLRAPGRHGLGVHQQHSCLEGRGAFCKAEGRVSLCGQWALTTKASVARGSECFSAG